MSYSLTGNVGGKQRKANTLVTLCLLEKKSYFNYVSITLTKTSTLYDFSSLPIHFFLGVDNFPDRGSEGRERRKEGRKNLETALIHSSVILGQV